MAGLMKIKQLKSMRIYLDNASTTPVLPEVIDEMTSILREDFGNPSSIHMHGRKARSIIENARKKVAKILNASVGEIFFTSSATEANNMMLKNAVQDLGIRHIITSPTEHHCVLHSLDYLARNTSCTIDYLTVSPQGKIDMHQLEEKISKADQKTLVSIMFGNNEIGTMHDIQKIGELCRKHQVLFHCDAVQVLGKYPVDVQSLGVHFLSGSAHKFHGPKGIGLAYISSDTMLTPFIHGGAQERNMRAGTENVAGIAGLATALDWSGAKMAENHRHILEIKHAFIEALKHKITGVAFNGSEDATTLAHILSVSFPPHPAGDLLVMNLDIAGISASSGSACSSGIETDSHVLQAIGHDSRRRTIRFSFSPFTSLEEIAFASEKIAALVT
jgi:cysteine desulfurase